MSAESRLISANPVAVFETQHPSTLILMQSLGEHSVPMHVFSPSRFPPGRLSRHCSRFELCPPPDRFTEFQGWLRNRIRSGQISRVAPTSDLMAYHCADLRDEFPTVVRDTIHTLAEIEAVLIKSRFTRRCDALGIAVPSTWFPASLDEAATLAPTLPYPVIIKGQSHLGLGMSRGRIVADATEFLREFRALDAVAGQEPLLERYPELRWPMVQPCPPSARLAVYSVCGMRDRNSGIVAAAAVCKTDQWPPGVGTGTSFAAVDDSATIAAGSRIVDAFVAHGLFEVELLVDGDRRPTIDFNPRAYQMISLDVARGNDLPWLWYRSTLGEPASLQPPAAQGIQWRRKLHFHASYWTRVLSGPDRRGDWRRYRDLVRIPAVGGTEGLPLFIRLACELRVLRHPRSLIR